LHCPIPGCREPARTDRCRPEHSRKSRVGPHAPPRLGRGQGEAKGEYTGSAPPEKAPMPGERIASFPDPPLMDWRHPPFRGARAKLRSPARIAIPQRTRGRPTAGGQRGGRRGVQLKCSDRNGEASLHQDPAPDGLAPSPSNSSIGLNASPQGGECTSGISFRGARAKLRSPVRIAVPRGPLDFG
jgi:hypothetical protein